MGFEGGMMTANVRVSEGVSQNGVPIRVRYNFVMLKHCENFVLQHQGVIKKHLESDEEGICELHHMSVMANLRAVAAHLDILGILARCSLFLLTPSDAKFCCFRLSSSKKLLSE